MKVITEKRPGSVLALDIELEKDQVEKGLDRAARRLSQKHTVPGFRKGKAPRFIIENYFGREALMEEASEDLIKRGFQQALEQEAINPVGPANLESIEPSEQFRFRITVPVSPTVTLPDYRAIRLPFERSEVTDELVDHAMNRLRDKHVVLKELEEPRPARAGDQLTLKMQTLVDGEPLEQPGEDGELPETTLVLEPDRLVDELYAGLVGIHLHESREIAAHIPDDHPNEEVRGKDVVFHVEVTAIQERLLPDWEELPALEEFDGTLEALRTKTRQEMETAAQQHAEQKVFEGFIEQLIAQTEYDIPMVLIQEMAQQMLHEQVRQFAQYGITLEHMLQYRNQTMEEAVEELLPDAERQLKIRLALQSIIEQEQFIITEEEIAAEIEQIVHNYSVEERENAIKLLHDQLRSTVISGVLERKLRERVVAIAAGVSPALAVSDPDASQDTSQVPQDVAPISNPDAVPAATPSVADAVLGYTEREP